MTHQHKSHLEIEDRGAVLIVRVDGGPHSVFGLDIANELDALVSRVDRDPNVHAVVFTGAREGRFVSHADVRWLQAEGAATTPGTSSSTSANPSSNWSAIRSSSLTATCGRPGHRRERRSRRRTGNAAPVG